MKIHLLLSSIYYSVLFVVISSSALFAQLTSRPIATSSTSYISNNSYYLPRNTLMLEFSYTLVTNRKVISQKGQYDNISPIEKFKSLSIDNAVVLQEEIIPDYQYHYELFPTNGKASNSEYSIELLDGSIVKSFNAKNESVVSDVIDVVGTTITTVIKLVSAVKTAAVAGLTEEQKQALPEVKVEEITRTIPFKGKIDFSSNPTSFTFGYASANDIINTVASISDFPSTIPMVTVNIAPVNSVTITNNSPAVGTDLPGIVYRKPAIYNVQVNIMNNGLIAKQIVHNRNVKFPQLGSFELASLIKKNRNEDIGVEFDKGTFVKYSYKRQSNVKKSLEALNKSANAINDQIGSLRDEAKKQKEEDETKNSTSAKVQKQIDDIKLQKQLLELQKQLRELQKEEENK